MKKIFFILAFLWMIMGIVPCQAYKNQTKNCQSYSIVSNVMKQTSTLYMDPYNRVPNTQLSILRDSSEIFRKETYDQIYTEVPDGTYIYEMDSSVCEIILKNHRYFILNDDSVYITIPCGETTKTALGSLIDNDFLFGTHALEKVRLTYSENLSVCLLNADDRFQVENGLLYVSPIGDEAEYESIQYVVSFHELVDTATVHIFYSFQECPEEISDPVAFDIVPDGYFSPNGDGIHDVWEIKELNQFQHYTVRIYNRYGKVLKCFKNEPVSWNGELDGCMMPSTDYWYSLFIDDIEFSKTGHFRLCR